MEISRIYFVTVSELKNSVENDSIEQRELQFYARSMVTKAKSPWMYGFSPIYSLVMVSLVDNISLHHKLEIDEMINMG